MRHLVNTFLDGGESAEKKWLAPLLGDSIKDSDFRLRLSNDVTKMLHALAKCLGEGIGLYGKGEGAKHFRPWLENKHSNELYWHLTRVDKGTRQDSKTEAAFAAYWNRSVRARWLWRAARARASARCQPIGQPPNTEWRSWSAITRRLHRSSPRDDDRLMA